MGLLGFYLRLVVLAIIVQAAPLNVTTTTYEGLYGSITIGQEPRGRGTFGIATSSSVTFIFSVWTAVHPNIVPGAPGQVPILPGAVVDRGAGGNCGLCVRSVEGGQSRSRGMAGENEHPGGDVDRGTEILEESG